MKKATIILILSFFTSMTWAQSESFPYGFKLGLTTSPNFGWVKAEDGKGNGSGLGFSYGLLGDFNFSQNYSFSTGLTITSINGSSIEPNVSPYHTGSSTENYNLKYKMQYIEVPLTVKLKTTRVADLRWYGQFGLSNDFNISAKQDAELNGTSIADGKNISDYAKFYRAGLILGGGGEYFIDEHTSIVAGLTFNNGFTSITKDRKVRNHYFGINLSVFF